MRIPLTKYGWPQVVVYPVVVVVGMLGAALVGYGRAPVWALATVELALAAVLVWALMFFRDPHRDIPTDDAVLMAPADGKVTDIETLEETDLFTGPTLRIGVFLSIFNTHINRAPCNVTVEKITYRKGRYVNAMNPLSSKVNESNTLVMVRANEPKDRLAVKQISGAIARRIVCAAREEQQLARGEKFGMIKFGSRTELYIPAHECLQCTVEVGDNVKAGITPMVRYAK
ncbi:MAG: phosphatidylserine decarboxylase family protein [Phycisphaerales bacterium]|nr:MAG: phosphatidylserine decarboxylase family protein [Phycisphaerales bacterium]